LKEVTVVERDAVRFLANAEAAGIRIVNCPDYVRRWIEAEKSRKEDRLHSLAEEEGK